MAVEPLDMRSGTEAALARVVAVFGAARPHHGYPSHQTYLNLMTARASNKNMRLRARR